MVFTFRNRLKIIIQQSMPATSNISNMGYFKINITVILTILLFLILKMMRFLLANHSLIISLCTVCLFQICGQWKCFEDYRNTCIEDFFHEIYLSSIYFYLTSLIMNWQMILNTEKNTHFHHSFTCWFISLHLATSMMVWSFSRPSLTAFVSQARRILSKTLCAFLVIFSNLFQRWPTI